jgi:hypothetical protein
MTGAVTDQQSSVIHATLMPVLWLIISIVSLLIGLFAIYVILVIFFFKKLLRPHPQAVVRKGAAGSLQVMAARKG